MLEIVSAIVLVCTAVVVHRKFGLISWHNPFVLFWWYHVVFLWIGLFYRSLYAWQIEIVPSVFYMIWLGMISALTGAVLANYFFGWTAGIAKPSGAALDFEAKHIRCGLALLCVGAGIGAALLYYKMVGCVPFLAEDADNFRIEARQGRGWLVLLSLALLQYGTIAFAAVSGAQKRSALKVLVIIGLAAAAAIGMGNRAPGLEICFFGILTYLLFRGKRPSLKRIGLLAGVGLAAMALLGIVRQGLEMSGLMIAAQMTWRPFTNIQNVQLIYDFFTSHHPLLMGKGYWIDLSVLMPGYSPNFGSWFKEQAGLEFSGGSVTVSYLGEIFANFGIAGIPILGVIYGFVLSSCNALLTRGGGGNRTLMLIILAISLKSVVSSGVVSVVLYNVIPLLTIHCVFECSARLLQTLWSAADMRSARSAA